MNILEITGVLIGLLVLFGLLNHEHPRGPDSAVFAVAPALSLPVDERRPAILTMAYAVVLFSTIVQGLTIKPLVERIVRHGAINDLG